MLHSHACSSSPENCFFLSVGRETQRPCGVMRALRAVWMAVLLLAGTLLARTCAEPDVEDIGRYHFSPFGDGPDGERFALQPIVQRAEVRGALRRGCQSLFNALNPMRALKQAKILIALVRTRFVEEVLARLQRWNRGGKGDSMWSDSPALNRYVCT